MKKIFAVLALMLAVVAAHPATVTVFSTNQTWRFATGASEASSPIAAWRSNTFNDVSFANAPAPFWYDVTGDTSTRVGGTQITGMQNTYLCIFLRKQFVLANTAYVTNLQLNACIDDGFVAWINGYEVLRVNPPPEPFTIGSSVATAATEPVAFATYNLPPPAAYLDASGTNVLTVQVFNAGNTSSDLDFDTELLATSVTPVNVLAPGNPIVGVAATPGSSVSSIAVSGGGSGNAYPTAESPPNSIDANTGTKYLNFAKINCGFIVTSPNGLVKVNGFQFTTANDAVERDPATVTIEGTSAPDPTTAAAGSTWVQIYSGPSGLAGVSTRTTAGAAISFINSNSFNTYRMLITDVSNQGAANSMQFSEIQFQGQFASDFIPPTVANFLPAAGTVEGPVSSLTVQFSEPVTGVNASDLLLNGTPASSITGSGANYVFTFPPLPLGTTTVSFADSPGIADFAAPPNPFNPTNVTWQYNVVDTTAPVIGTYVPLTNTVVRSLTGIEVIFSEEVTNVEASDLLINNVPATDLVLGVPGQYAFTFPQPATGVVQVAWAAGHGITDLAPVPNNFGGGAWTYTLDPNFSFDVRINEFMADNQNGIRDEDGTRQDWLELYNATVTTVNLAGWSLTDDAGNLGKWHFPAGAMMPANSYLLVWCSSKDRTNNIAAYHTNFKLAKEGGFLALVLPDGTNIASSFAPYPAQRTDASYGRDRVDPSIVGFYNTPTPGTANTQGGPGDFSSDVIYSLTSKTFVTPFNLTLSTASTNAVIRYVLVTTAAQAAASVTNIPTTNSPIYTGAIPISVTTEVRARAFQTGLFPSAPMTESYVQIDSAVRDFSSDIPVMVVHMLGNGSIPQLTTTASGILMAFDNDEGRSSLTNAPQTASRMGIHARGSSTINNAKTNMRIETWDEFNQDAKYPLLGMPSDSDWVLYGINGYDPGLMHNAIYQWLGRQVGVFNMRTRFVEVFNKLNTGPVTMSDYFGLYVLLETPKVGKDRVDIATIHNEDTNATAITGGYIMKIDRIDASNPEANLVPPPIGTIRTTPAPIEFTDPPYHATEADPRRLLQINYAKNYILNFITNLASASYTNPVTGYAQYINPDQWVNHLIANIVPFNVDGYRLSGYFYKDRNGRLEQGPMWDCDRCMGTGGTTAGTTTPQADNRAFSPRFWRLPAFNLTDDNGTDFFGVSNVGVSWFTPLFRDPNFWQRFIDRYQSVRTNEYSSNAVVAMVDGYYNEIKEAQVREQARWAPSAFTFPRSGSQTINGYTFDFGPADVGSPARGRFTNEVTFQKKWLLDRFEFMDTNFLAMPTLSSGTALVPSGTIFTAAPAAKANSLLLYTLDGTDPRLLGGAVSPNARTNVGALTLTVTNNIRIFARSYNTSHANMTNSGTEVGKPLINSFWSGPVAATYYTEVPSLRITELMYHPAPSASIFDTNDPDNFEYLELQNIGTNTLNLIGFSFINGIDFTFTATNGVTNLGPGQFVLIVKNVNSFTARYGLHTNVAGAYGGNLDNAGERLTLVGPRLEPILDFTYSDEWYSLSDGIGFSLVIRDPNAPLNSWGDINSWRISAGENGSAGAGDPAPPELPVVLVNEALTHTVLPELDTIELFNPGTNDANIGGWYLTDNPNTPKKFHIPPDTMIPAGGFILFTEDDFNAGGPTSFSLNSSGDEVFLFSATNGLLSGYTHGFDFAAAQSGVAFGRYVNSQGNEDFVAQSTTNTFLATNAPPLVGPIVVSEIMYHPPDVAVGTNIVDNSLDEFIELYNITTNAVPLYHPTNTANTWKLSKAVDFTFPPNISIAPTSFVLVVNFNPNTNASQLAAFRARYGVSNSIPLFGPYDGKLDNAGANIHLARPDNTNLDGSVPYILVDRVQYNDSGAWSAIADGAGASLQRLVPSEYGNDPTNWIAASTSAGIDFRGGTPPIITQQPTDATVIAGSAQVTSSIYRVGSTNFIAALSGENVSIQWRFNGVPIPGATNAVLTLTNIQVFNAGLYSYLAFNGGGSVFSSNALLTVLAPVMITIQPTNQNVLPGTNVTLVASAVGTGAIRYQWRFEGTNILNATNNSYSFTGANLFDHHGNFSVVIQDDISQIVSANAFIYVLVRPFVTTHITSQTVLQGQNATFSLVATGAPPLWYRWIRNGGSILGATTSVPVLVITNVQASGTIRVAVTNVALPSSGTGAFSPGPAAGQNVQLIMLPDADGDGMWDVWETNHFGNLFGTNFALVLPGADPDGDGMSNLDEYRSGTIPTNALSVLKIVLTATNANVLEFVAQTNLTYSVQSRTNLADAVWNNITNISLSPNVRTIRVDSATAPAGNERFFRVITPQAP